MHNALLLWKQYFYLFRSIFKKGEKNKQNFISICFAVFVLMSNAQRLNLTNGSTVKLLTQRNLNLFLFTNPDVCFSSTNKFD